MPADAADPADVPGGAAAGSATPSAVDIFDTTLRDGAQFEGISLTVEDKLRVAEQLDYLGVAWVEGGYPGANPKDEEFFRRAVSELDLHTATLVAFGSTRRPLGRSDDDPTSTIQLDGLLFTRLAGGRVPLAEHAEDIRYSGDEAVGRRVVEHLNYVI